jgi:hypothetical protein
MLTTRIERQAGQRRGFRLAKYRAGSANGQSF